MTRRVPGTRKVVQFNRLKEHDTATESWAARSECRCQYLFRFEILQPLVGARPVFHSSLVLSWSLFSLYIWPSAFVIWLSSLWVSGNMTFVLTHVICVTFSHLWSRKSTARFAQYNFPGSMLFEEYSQNTESTFKWRGHVRTSNCFWPNLTQYISAVYRLQIFAVVIVNIFHVFWGLRIHMTGIPILLEQAVAWSSGTLC